MTLRALILAGLFSALAMPALAVVKVYNSTAPNGTPGDRFAYSTTQCPPIQVTAAGLQGSVSIDDTGGGSATMTALEIIDGVVVSRPDLTNVFGPGAFVFVNSVPTITISTTPAGVGSTAPSGSVSWGVIGGWSNTGLGFCIASPQTICTSGAMIPHGITSPLDPINSPTYDLGTWSFDAVGDYEADNNYIWRTSNGGTSNGQRLLRGAYVGAGVPALPLIGAGALAVGLLAAGTRSLLRRK